MANLEFCDKHNMVAYLVKSEGSEGFHEIIDFLTSSHIYYALTECPTLYISLIEQFWQTAALSTTEDGVHAITATIDGRDKIITEASIRRHLKLQDSEGLSSLPNAEIFEQLARMGSKKTAWDQFSSNIATAIICLATNRIFNFSRFIFDAMVKNLDSTHKFLMYPRFIQILLNKQQRLLLPHTRTYSTPTLTNKLFNNMRRASKGYSGVVTPLFDTMLVQPQGEAPSTSPSRITSSPSLSSHPITSSTLNTPPSFQTTHEVEETATMPHDSPLPGGHTPRSDEGRLKHDELMELVTKLSDRVVAVEEDLKQTKKTYSTALTKLVLKVKKLEKQVRSGKTQEKNSADTKVLLEEETPTELIKDLGSGEKGEKEISIADVPVSTAGAEVSAATHDVSTDIATLVYIKRSASKAKDKGKAIMQEPKPPKKLKKRVQVQMSVDEELARKVQEEEQAKAMAEQEQERINFEAALELQRKLNEREENRPYYVAEVRKNLVMYLKNQAGYKQSYFKGMKYEEIRPIFENVWDQTHTFVPIDLKDKEKDSKKKGSRTKSLARKRAGEKQSKESTKRQKIEDDVEKEELKSYLDMVPREEFAMEIESLAIKYPIVDWKTHVLTENFMYYQIFRADGSFKNYKIISEMLDDFDRQDKNQHEYNLINWRLFDSCGIHILLMNNGIAIHMLIEKKYPLTQEMLPKMLSRKLEVDHENEMAFELLRGGLLGFKASTLSTASYTDDAKVSIPSVERPWLSEAKGFILPNHDTGRILPAESQRNTTNPLVATTDSSASDYDSTDESSVCSTTLSPLEKLAGAEPVYGPKTIKSILKSNSTFNSEALKGVTP
ncbi:hypothetical protein Tco_0177800 [Tanacetum coccineum]